MNIIYKIQKADTLYQPFWYNPEYDVIVSYYINKGGSYEQKIKRNKT